MKSAVGRVKRKASIAGINIIQKANSLKLTTLANPPLLKNIPRKIIVIKITSVGVLTKRNMVITSENTLKDIPRARIIIIA
ncbi:hypothetical protein SDC9_199181 [bioreactor metagenome]|uniref:Uncharacterized protein n=1 Tax=bioreactor metagenome TaxID=1076179 RepID=A0A645IWG6_9ZZZZ